ncbi:MAG: transcription termination/antitermination protein NusG [Rhodospirillales bacterium]
MMRWYAVHTHAGAELKALMHLEQQGFQAYLPRYLRRRSHARRVTWSPSPLFPRYLFAAMDLGAQRWRAVNSTIGVSRLVTQGDAPAPAPEGVVEALRAHENAEGVIDFKTRFKKGDRVIITEGPFMDRVGLLENMPDDHRVIVLLDLLGRETRVALGEASVQLAV